MEERLLKLFKLTKQEYFADFFITPPVTLVLLVMSIMTSWSMYWVPGFVFGAFVWTLYEYVIHKYISHEFWVFKKLHRLHHDDPNDYIAIPPYATVAIYVVFWTIFGFHTSTAAMVGFSVGYCVYSALHTAFHYSHIKKTNWLFYLRLRHSIHHAYDTYNYGVTQSWWDRLFGTEFRS